MVAAGLALVATAAGGLVAVIAPGGVVAVAGPGGLVAVAGLDGVEVAGTGAGWGVAWREAWGAGRGGAVRGASPVMTERGWEDRPTLWLVRRLADQATAAVATIPSSAVAAHNRRTRVTGGRPYRQSG